MSSSPHQQNTSPVMAPTPALRAKAPANGLGDGADAFGVGKRDGGPSSRDPSLTTTISISDQVWARALSIASRMEFAQVYTGTVMETFGPGMNRPVLWGSIRLSW